MSAHPRSANRWLATGQTPDGTKVSIVDGGVGMGRRTGVAHHVSEAAELTSGTQTVLAARWLCGGQSVDAVMLVDGAEPTCVGCRLAAAVPQRPVVYFCWNGKDELLYVGSSINVAQRIRGHMANTQWWSEVRRMTFDEYDTEFEVRRAESEAIADSPGRHNKQGRITPRATATLALIEGIQFGESS